MIDDTPANRFGHIQAFVSVPSLEREEASLSELIKNNQRLQKSQEGNVSKRNDELKALYNDWHKGAKAAPELKDWCKSVLAENRETQAEQQQILSILEREISNLRSGFKVVSASFEDLQKKTGASKLTNDKLKEIAAENASALGDALKLLEEAKTYIETAQPEVCPVCDTPKSSEFLSESVAKKLESLNALSAQSELAKSASEALSTAKTVLATQLDSFFETIVKLRDAHTAAVEVSEWQVVDLIAPLKTPASVGELTVDWFNGLKKEAANLKPLSEWADANLLRVKNANEMKAKVEVLSEQIADSKAEFEALAKIIAKADAIKEIFRSERIKYANETLNSISTDFAEMYNSVHPGEDIEHIRLYLHPDRKGSACLTGPLHGKEDASPVAYLSESHLDTLGLCLFIALEKRNRPAQTILFLDDEIASVDEAHMSQLYEMIVAQSEYFKHVFISSHYQPLRFKFKWGQLTKQNIDFIEFSKWSLDQGIALNRGTAPEIERLKVHLAQAEDAQIIASKSGIVLEYILDFLTGIYRCRLPRHPGAEQRWSLGDYKSGLESNKKKLLGALECQHVDEAGSVVETYQLEPILTKIFTQLELRNALGAHYKEMAGQFDDIAEAVQLGKSTVELVDALCDADLQLPESNKNGRCWVNKGGKITRHLYPLQQPQ